MHLSDEEKKIGRDNYARVLDKTLTKDHPNRREAMTAVLVGGTVLGAGLGATYYGYSKALGNPLRVGIIGTGDEGNVLIGALNPDFIEVKAIADIRPYSIHRAFHGDQGALDARPGLMKVYGWKTEDEARKHVKVYTDNYMELIKDPDIEAVIIALPLWIHDQAAIAAMREKKHVLTEKLMAHSVHQCKEMARVAYETGMLLATGHQRHYSVLYENAVDTIKRGLIGDIHHIRAQWHRGNLPGNDSWQPPLPPSPADRYETYDEAVVKLEKEYKAGLFDAKVLDEEKKKLAKEFPLYANLRSAKNALKGATGKAIDAAQKKVDQINAQIADLSLDPKLYGYEEAELPGGYKRSSMEELIRWRLFNRTGGGLMAELGSHQLDASGIFISAQFPDKVKVEPLSVVGVGGRHIFPPDRDVDDHVYCMYEYPGKGYYKDDDPKKEVADPNKKVVVTYSSINGNGYGGYGEVVLGTAGTLILDREQETMLWGKSGSTTSVGLSKDNKALDSYETGGGPSLAAAALSGPISRGYTEEIEHWAWCIRNNYPIEKLHCHPKVALGDAVIALASNIAMKENRRIEFKPEWFDPMSDETPEGIAPRKADEIA